VWLRDIAILRCELASRAKIARTVSRKHNEATRAFARATRLRCHLCAAFCAGGARRAGKFDSTTIFHRAIRIAIAGAATTTPIEARPMSRALMPRRGVSRPPPRRRSCHARTFIVPVAQAFRRDA
jgi:hypothetical protein